MSLKPHFVKIEKHQKFKFILAILCMPSICRLSLNQFVTLQKMLGRPDGGTVVGKNDARVHFIGLIRFSRSKFQDFEARILVLTSS